MKSTTQKTKVPSARLKVRKSFLVSAVLFLIVFYVGLSGYAATRLVRVERLPLVITPKDFGLSYEDVVFPSDIDALRIKGWYIPAEGSHRIIIMVHGEKCHRANPSIAILEIARAMVEQGFTVLTFDLRGRGESPAGYNTLGFFEQRDLKGAVRYAISRGFADLPGVFKIQIPKRSGLPEELHRC